MTRYTGRAFLLAGLVCAVAGCYGPAPSRGGGQGAIGGGRVVNPKDVALPPGYRIEAVATGLNFPTAVAFDGAGNVCVVESGYCYGEVFATPRLVRIGGSADGQRGEIARGTAREEGPWTGAVFHEGSFYVADGGEMKGGRILKISGDGKITPLIENLPSMGDHHTNGPAIGPDGKLYFAVGTATNSGVVGTDNAQFGWLKRHPDFHDIPARDITLTGQNFTSDNPLKGGTASTGAFSAFGTQTTQGQVIKGQLPATGAVMRIPLDATPQDSRVELVAWGLRNPFGLTFAPEGQLLVTENSFDVRGSRPVWGTGDYLWSIDVGQPAKWYGWPDFHGSEPLTNQDWFQPSGKPELKFLLAQHPNAPMEPSAKLPVHSSACRLDVSKSDRFGHVGEAFVPLFGDMAPTVGKVMSATGFMVVRVDVKTGVSEPFAMNRGKGDARPFGPASKQAAGVNGGLERPVDARFSPDGSALYVVDFGVVAMTEKGAAPVQNTGVVWKITREVRP